MAAGMLLTVAMYNFGFGYKIWVEIAHSQLMGCVEAIDQTIYKKLAFLQWLILGNIA